MRKRTTARKYINRNQVTGRPAKYASETIAELYATGVSAAEVGRMLGVHHTTVLYTLNCLGIKTGDRARGTSPMANLERRLEALLVAATAASDHVSDLLDSIDDVDQQRNEILGIQIRADEKLAELALVMPAEDCAAVEARRAERVAKKKLELEQKRASDDARIGRMMQIVTRKKGWAA